MQNLNPAGGNSPTGCPLVLVVQESNKTFFLLIFSTPGIQREREREKPQESVGSLGRPPGKRGSTHSRNHTTLPCRAGADSTKGRLSQQKCLLYPISCCPRPGNTPQATKEEASRWL